MFVILTTLPKLSAIPIMNELYYALQYSENTDSFVVRGDQLTEDERGILSVILQGLAPSKSSSYLKELNDIFDKITGFTGIPRSQSLVNNGQYKDDTQKASSLKEEKSSENKVLIIRHYGAFRTNTRGTKLFKKVAGLLPLDKTRVLSGRQTILSGKKKHVYKNLFINHAKPLHLTSLRVVKKTPENNIVKSASVLFIPYRQLSEEYQLYSKWLKQSSDNSYVDFTKNWKISIYPEEQYSNGEMNLVSKELRNNEGVLWEVNRIRELVNQLPEDYPLLISLLYFDEKTPKEIAVNLNVSESLIKVKLKKAKALLFENWKITNR